MTGSLKGGTFTTTSTRKYYALGGTSIMDDNGTLRYMLSDQQGSTVAVTAADGSLTSSQRYMPFGQVRVDVGSITQTDFGYTGQRSMSSIGLMDYKARFYDQSLGRFIQPDTIVSNPASPQTWNRYSYVVNNPINMTDPTGHKEECAYNGSQLECKKVLDPTIDTPINCQGYHGQEYKDCVRGRNAKNEYDKFVLNPLKPSSLIILWPAVYWDAGKRVITLGEFSLLHNNGEMWTGGLESILAGQVAEQFFPGQSDDSTQRNAFKHAYWNALMTSRKGVEYAEAFATAHEANPDPASGDAADHFMDLYNNAVGRRIAVDLIKKGRSLEIASTIYKAVLNGEMVIVLPIEYGHNRLIMSNYAPTTSYFSK